MLFAVNESLLKGVNHCKEFTIFLNDILFDGPGYSFPSPSAIVDMTEDYLLSDTQAIVVGGLSLSFLLILPATKKIISNCFKTAFSFLIWPPVLYISSFLLGTTSQTQGLLHQACHIRLTEPYWFVFLALGFFKGLKIVIHTVSYYLLTNPARPLINPTNSPSDVTVIVPTVSGQNPEFEDCIKSILANFPGKIIIVTVGQNNLIMAANVCRAIDKDKIEVIAVKEANKRAQFLYAAEKVDTNITCWADDTVFWPKTFLREALAPFEDPLVGLVGTVKRVRRDRSGGTWASILNYIGCMYLERHNFECTASYNLDGGVFIISGRTALARTQIIQSREYRKGFLNETWSSLFRTVGPMKVDDDNFTTRLMVRQGYKTVFHNHPNALMETVLGNKGGKKMHGQLKRWVRSTWRSNSTSLFVDRACWKRHPWTTYAMFLSSFVNFALLYDGALLFTLIKSGRGEYWPVFLLALLVTKIIKPLPHLIREPRDILFLPIGILFGYVHSFYKAYALLTAGNIEWTGREGIKATG